MIYHGPSWRQERRDERVLPVILSPVSSVMLDEKENKVKAKGLMRTKSEALRLYSSSTCHIQPGSHLYYWGLALIISGVTSFIAFLYAAILSKILPPSGIPLLSSIENDWYYCLLVPLTLPILLILVYFHWLSMKLFKHA